VFAPKPLNEFEILKRKAIRAASDTADAYIQNWTRWVIGWDESYRGRLNEARDASRELLEVGRLLNGPRSTGFGLNLLSLRHLTEARRIFFQFGQMPMLARVETALAELAQQT
jgi:hypothetical protein